MSEGDVKNTLFCSFDSDDFSSSPADFCMIRMKNLNTNATQSTSSTSELFTSKPSTKFIGHGNVERNDEDDELLTFGFSSFSCANINRSRSMAPDSYKCLYYLP